MGICAAANSACCAALPRWANAPCWCSTNATCAAKPRNNGCCSCCGAAAQGLSTRRTWSVPARPRKAFPGLESAHGNLQQKLNACCGVWRRCCALMVKSSSPTTSFCKAAGWPKPHRACWIVNGACRRWPWWSATAGSALASSLSRHYLALTFWPQLPSTRKWWWKLRRCMASASAASKGSNWPSRSDAPWPAWGWSKGEPACWGPPSAANCPP